MEQRIVQFIAALRASGVRVSLAESADAFLAADQMGVMDRETFRISLRSTLIKNADDVPHFERLFPMFFQANQPPPLMNASQDLSPEDAKKLAEALRQLTEQMRQMMEKLLEGKPLSQEELNQLDRMVNMDNVSDPRLQNLKASQMEKALQFPEVREAIEALMKMLQEMGWTRKR
jgi:uncharacterized protein